MVLYQLFFFCFFLSFFHFCFFLFFSFIFLFLFFQNKQGGGRRPNQQRGGETKPTKRMVGPKERRGEKGRVLPTNKGGETAKPGKEWGDHPTKKKRRDEPKSEWETTQQGKGGAREGTHFDNQNEGERGGSKENPTKKGGGGPRPTKKGRGGNPNQQERRQPSKYNDIVKTFSPACYHSSPPTHIRTKSTILPQMEIRSRTNRCARSVFT